MIRVITDWYHNKMSNPDILMLLFMLVISAIVLVTVGGILAPVIVAIIIAYLLDWPVTQLVERNMKRGAATTLVLLVFLALMTIVAFGLLPTVWQQGLNLAKELPDILSKGQSFVMTLPEKYPEFVNAGHVENMLNSLNAKFVDFGQSLLSASLNSIVDLVALLVYLILVPLMVFFMLKDKDSLLRMLAPILPKERRLIKQVWFEMNGQVINYVRGKVIEILIVGICSGVTFALMDLRYAALLGVLVGFSVLIPYIGAAVVTFPVAIVALFQWGISPEFGYLMLAYGIIQALDGNLLVPILFSEAVNLHPVFIIIAVLFFGGIWGVWGVFFAIPLATLVKAVVNAVSESVSEQSTSA